MEQSEAVFKPKADPGTARAVAIIKHMHKGSGEKIDAFRGPAPDLQGLLYYGGAAAQAIFELNQMADDADRVAAALTKLGSRAKNALRSDFDGDGRMDNQLFALLRKFDRWFDIIDDGKHRKPKAGGGPVGDAPARLKAVADRARKIADVGRLGRVPIYNFEAAAHFIQGDYGNPNAKPDISGLKDRGPAHFSPKANKTIYLDKDYALVARPKGEWIALTANFFLIPERQQIAGIAHEWVHDLNAVEGRQRRLKLRIPTHIAIEDIDFSVKNVNVKLNRYNVIYNPSSYAAYIYGAEFEAVTP